MSLRDLTEAYLAGPAKLREAIGTMTRDQAVARPVPGKWSTLEVVCHLADFEPIYVDRMKRVIAFDNPALLAADENQFAAKLAYHERDLGEELALIELTRKQMARILRTLPDGVATRAGIHNERGSQTLAQLLQSAINHIKHHSPFIVEKRRALGLSG